MARAAASAKPEATPKTGGSKKIPEAAVKHLGDRAWRLDSLYTVETENGEVIPFRMNEEQRKFLDEAHNFNIILKARQLGFTTFICILMLDACLFNSNTTCGVIADTLPNAGKIFDKKIKAVFERLPDWLRRMRPNTTDNAGELAFANNSRIWVSTSHRGGTLQWLHISEYGKICAKSPEKAKEIRTGALNTVHVGNTIIVESTAEGADGHFFEMCERAKAKADAKQPLTPMDFKLHFFPWWKSPKYWIEPAGVVIAPSDEEYFAKLKATHGIDLSPGQKAWYVKKQEDQDEEMAREYPSTDDEPFFTAVEGAYYSKQLAVARTEGRIGMVPHEPSLPVYTMWDFGLDDYMACWHLQAHRLELRLIDFDEWSNVGLEDCLLAIKRKPYIFGAAAVPHDVSVRDLVLNKQNRKECFENHGFKLVIAPAGAGSVDEGIGIVRRLFNRFLFDETKCADGLKRLAGYRKEWDKARGVWLPKPRHDINCHGADALRTGAVVIDDLTQIIGESAASPLDALGGESAQSSW